MVDVPCANVSACGRWFECSSKSKFNFSPVLLILLLYTSHISFIRDYVLVRSPKYLMHYVDCTA